MLRTPLCDRLGIEAPIVGAPFGPWEQVELAAALCEAGALGSLGTGLRTVPELQAQWTRLREMTGRRTRSTTRCGRSTRRRSRPRSTDTLAQSPST